MRDIGGLAESIAETQNQLTNTSEDCAVLLEPTTVAGKVKRTVGRYVPALQHPQDRLNENLNAITGKLDQAFNASVAVSQGHESFEQEYNRIEQGLNDLIDVMTESIEQINADTELESDPTKKRKLASLKDTLEHVQKLATEHLPLLDFQKSAIDMHLSAETNFRKSIMDLELALAAVDIKESIKLCQAKVSLSGNRNIDVPQFIEDQISTAEATLAQIQAQLDDHKPQIEKFQAQMIEHHSGKPKTFEAA